VPQEFLEAANSDSRYTLVCLIVHLLHI